MIKQLKIKAYQINKETKELNKIGEYNSIVEAATKLKINTSNISRSINEVRPTVNDYQFFDDSRNLVGIDLDQNTIKYQIIKTDYKWDRVRKEYLPFTKTVTRLDPKKLEISERNVTNLFKTVVKNLKQDKFKLSTNRYKGNISDQVMIIADADRHLGYDENPNYTLNDGINDFKKFINSMLIEIIQNKPKKVVYANLGDFFQLNTTSKTTPAGTRLEGNSPFVVLERMLPILINGLNEFAKHSDVEFFYCPGNHDWDLAQGLMITLKELFKSQNVKIHCDKLTEAQQFKWGLNVFKFHHGHGLGKRGLKAMMLDFIDGKLPDEKVIFITGHYHSHIAQVINNVTWIQQPTACVRSSYENKNFFPKNSRKNIYYFFNKTQMVSEHHYLYHAVEYAVR